MLAGNGPARPRQPAAFARAGERRINNNYFKYNIYECISPFLKSPSERILQEHFGSFLPIPIPIAVHPFSEEVPMSSRLFRRLFPFVLASLFYASGSAQESDGARRCRQVPAAPAGLASPAQTSTSITLAWHAVAAPSGCTVTYSVYQGGSRALSGLTAARATRTDKTSLYANTIYSKNANAVPSTSANSTGGGLRYDHNVNPRLFVFGSGDFISNALQDLDACRQQACLRRTALLVVRPMF